MKITINGTNDAATVSSADVALSETNAALVTSGTLTAADVDNTPNTFKAATTVGTIGTFAINAAGAWTFTANSAFDSLNVGQNVNETFRVTSVDGTASSVKITINGTNDAAVISGDISGAVTEAGGVENTTQDGLSVSGQLSSTDVDNPANSFTAVEFIRKSTKGYGSYTLTAEGQWTYILDNSNAAVQGLNTGDTLTDTFAVTSIDGTAQVITVTITGANDAAVISGAISGAVVEAGGVNNDNAGTPSASGQLFSADVDNPANSFITVTDATKSDGGYGSYILTEDGQWTYTLDNTNPDVQALNPNATLTDTFTVTSIDGTPQVITVTINGTNDAPVGQDASIAMNEDAYFRLESTFVSREFGTQTGHVADAVQINNIPSPGVGKLTYIDGVTKQVVAVDIHNKVLTVDEWKSLEYTPNLFSPSVFGFTDVDLGDTLAGVRIDTLPDAQTQGQLMVHGQAVGAGATIAAANLSDLTFLSNQYFNGVVKFDFTVQDSHGAYAAASSVATITVAAINNTPTIEAPLVTHAYSGGGANGQGKLLTGIKFADVDSGTSDVTVTLSVRGGGTLIASAQSGVVVNTSSDGHTLTLTGSVQNINSLVNRTEGATYATAQGGVRFIASDIVAPTLTSIPEKLSDGRISLTISSSGGTLRADESLIPLDGAGAKLITITGQRSSTLTLVGNQDVLNNYINTLKGVVNEDVAYLFTAINDLGNTGIDPGLTGSSTNEKSSMVTVINIQPLNELARPNVAATAAPIVPLSGVTMVGLHRRGYGPVPRSEEAAEAAASGAAASGAAASGAAASGAAASVAFISIVGLAGVLAALLPANLEKRSEAPSPSPADHPNTEPVITCSPSINLFEDTPVKVTGISIADDCLSTDTISVTFTVSAGALTADLPNDITRSDKSTDLSLILQGPISSINNFLTSGKGLIYTPAPNANDVLNQPVDLKIEVDDLGHGGTGGSRLSSASTVMHVAAVQDSVSITGTFTGQVTDDVGVDSNGNLHANGQLTVLGDVDTRENADPLHGLFKTPSSLQGTYGVFTFNTTGSPSKNSDYGKWTYQADNKNPAIQRLNSGNTLTETLTVESTHGAASQVITVTINGTNDAPTVTGDTLQPYTPSADYTRAVTPAMVGRAFRLADVDSSSLSKVSLSLGNRQVGDVLELIGPHPEWMTITQNANAITLEGNASLADYEGFLSQIGFTNTLPNPDTVVRQFTLTVWDEQGAASAPATALLDVISPLSSRIAAFDAAQSASSNALHSGAADVVAKMLALMVARNNLAQEVRNVLVFGKEHSADLLQLGNSLQDALDKLGIDADYATDALTQTNASLLATTATALYKQDTGGLMFTNTTQAVLLRAANQVLIETRQYWYRELTHWLGTGTKQTDVAGNITYAWSDATASDAMVALLGHLYAGSTTTIPGITGAANLALPALGEPGALDAYNPAGAALTLTATQKQDLQQRVDLVRLVATNPGATNAQLALMALALVPTYPGTCVLYRADQLLKSLLSQAGVALASHTLDATQLTYLPAGYAQPLTLTDSGVAEWTTVDGQLVFTNATRTALIEQLSDQITLEGRQLQALQDALQTDPSGQYKLTQAMVDLLATLDVFAPTTAGATTGQYLLSADNRDSVVSQLAALGPLQVSTDGLALSADIALLISFNAAKAGALAPLNTDAAISAVTFKTMTATPEVVQMLQNMGITIDSVQRYTDMGMHNLLTARVLEGNANGSTTVYRDANNQLYLPQAVFDVAYNLLSLEYSQSGLTPATANPLQNGSYTAPTVSTAAQELVDATQPSALWDVRSAIGSTARVIDTLLAIDATTPITVGAGSTPALKLGMDWKFFQQTMADAGLALVDMGDIANALTTADQTKFGAATVDNTIYAAHTAEGELVMSVAAFNQLLGHTALAQYFAQRSERAHHAFGLLTQLEASNGVVVASGGTSTADATTLSRQSAADLREDGPGMGLVAVSAEALVQLTKLGVGLPTITARGTQFTQVQINAVKTTPKTALLDEAGSTYWMRSETRDLLLRGASSELQSSLQLAHLLDPANHPADTADIVTKALAVKTVLNTADDPGLVQTLTLTTAELTALHLVFTVGTDATLVGTAQLGTVYVDKTDASKLIMSSATKNWLYHQASAVQMASFDPATDAQAVASGFIAANQHLRTLSNALSLGDDQPVIIAANAGFQAWVKDQSSTAQQLGSFSALTQPTGQAALTPKQVQGLFTPAGSYALDGDNIRTSLATYKLWQAAAETNALAAKGKADLYSPTSLESLLSAAPAANVTNVAAKFAAQTDLARAKAATQTALFDITPVPGHVDTAYLAQITLQDKQLAAMQQELLAQLVPNWAVASATAGTGGGYGFLVSKETLELLGDIEPKLKQLGIDDLGTTSAGDHIISAGTRLALFTHLAAVRETYSPLLDRAAHTNDPAASLLATLDAAADLVNAEGLVSLAGANAALLAGAVLKLGAANSYKNTPAGRQELLHAALGTVQIEGDKDGTGTLHMSLDTLRLLQAEVAGWVTGSTAPALLTSTQLIAAVAINQLMDAEANKANHTQLLGAIAGLKVSNALLTHAASLGITLQAIDTSAKASALADGSAMQLGVYTLDGSDVIISTATVAWLEQLTQAQAQDTLGALNLGAPVAAINPLERWNDHYYYDTLLDRLEAGTGTALVGSTESLYGSNVRQFGSTLVTTSTNSTAALMDKAVQDLAADGYLGFLAYVSPADAQNSPLTDSQYTVLPDGSVLMTEAGATMARAVLGAANVSDILQENRTVFATLLDTYGGKNAVADTALLKLNVANLPTHIVYGVDNIDALKVYTKLEEDALATAVVVPGAFVPPPPATKYVAWETLQQAEAAYHKALDAATAAKPDVKLADVVFGTITVGAGVDATIYNVSTLHSAYLSLQTDPTAYVQDASGNFIMSGGARDRVLESVATSTATRLHTTAGQFISMLSAAVEGVAELAGVFTVPAENFKNWLSELSITPYYTAYNASTMAADIGQTNAVVYNATDKTYTMSAATRTNLLAQARQSLAPQNEQSAKDALADLAQSYGVSTLADFIQTNNQWVYGDTPLLAHAVGDNDPATPTQADKYIVALKLDTSLYGTLTATGGVFATTTQSTLGTTAATRYDSLYTQGNIALDEANHTIYMSAETYADKLGQQPANAATDLVCVNAADFADKLDQNREWVSYRMLSSLGAQSSFNDNQALARALNAQPAGTAFKDSRGMFWMNNQTATTLGIALRATLSVDYTAIALATEQTLPEVSATLLGALASDVPDFTEATHYKAYALTTDQVSALQQIGIKLNQAPANREDWQSPPLSTYILDIGNEKNVWVSAQTFQFLGQQLKGMVAWNAAVGSQTVNVSRGKRRLLSEEDITNNLHIEAKGALTQNALELSKKTLFNKTVSTGNTPNVVAIASSLVVIKSLEEAGYTEKKSTNDLELLNATELQDLNDTNRKIFYEKNDLIFMSHASYIGQLEQIEKQLDKQVKDVAYNLAQSVPYWRLQGNNTNYVTLNGSAAYWSGIFDIIDPTLSSSLKPTTADLDNYSGLGFAYASALDNKTIITKGEEERLIDWINANANNVPDLVALDLSQLKNELEETSANRTASFLDVLTSLLGDFRGDYALISTARTGSQFGTGSSNHDVEGRYPAFKDDFNSLKLNHLNSLIELIKSTLSGVRLHNSIPLGSSRRTTFLSDFFENLPKILIHAEDYIDEAELNYFKRIVLYDEEKGAVGSDMIIVENHLGSLNVKLGAYSAEHFKNTKTNLFDEAFHYEFFLEDKNSIALKELIDHVSNMAAHTKYIGDITKYQWHLRLFTTILSIPEIKDRYKKISNWGDVKEIVSFISGGSSVAQFFAVLGTDYMAFPTEENKIVANKYFNALLLPFAVLRNYHKSLSEVLSADLPYLKKLAITLPNPWKIGSLDESVNLMENTEIINGILERVTPKGNSLYYQKKVLDMVGSTSNNIKFFFYINADSWSLAGSALALRESINAFRNETDPKETSRKKRFMYAAGGTLAGDVFVFIGDLLSIPIVQRSYVGYNAQGPNVGSKHIRVTFLSTTALFTGMSAGRISAIAGATTTSEIIDKSMGLIVFIGLHYFVVPRVRVSTGNAVAKHVLVSTIGVAFLCIQTFLPGSASKLIINGLNLDVADGGNGRRLTSQNNLYDFLLNQSALNSSLSVAVWQHAKEMGVDGNYYEVIGSSLLEDNSQSFGLLVYQVQSGELSVIALSAKDEVNRLIHATLTNTTGDLATYFIRAENPILANPYIDVDVSESTAESTNRFIVANQHTIIHGGDSLDIYHLLKALDTVVNPSDTSQALAGYIVDGLGVNTGFDLVTFDMAQSGQTIHTGAGYNGLVSYQGIYNFVGSEFADTFTRYGSLAQDDFWVSYAGGGGNDTFDLRAGNNSVVLDGGWVALGASGTPDGNTAPSLAHYDNHMTATNENDVGLVVSDDANQWFEVYGNVLADDTVWLQSSVQDQGVQLRNHASSGAVSGHASIKQNGYLLSRYASGAASTQFGFFNALVENFYGTLFADRITLDATSTLKVVDGMGGADTIDVDVAGIEVTGGGQGSLVRLGSGATGATVYANAGNTVCVVDASGVSVNAEDNDSDMSTMLDLQQAAGATVNAGSGSQITVKQAQTQTATVNIDWDGVESDFWGELFEVMPNDAGVSKVSVTDTASAGTLVVNANDGFAKVQMGGSSTANAAQATKVNVGTQMDSLWVIADQANALFLDLYFDNPDAQDTVNDLQSLATGAGVAGKLTKSAAADANGLYTFSGSWQHGSTSTQLSMSFADANKVNLHFGPSGNQTSYTLAHIV